MWKVSLLSYSAGFLPPSADGCLAPSLLLDLLFHFSKDSSSKRNALKPLCWMRSRTPAETYSFFSLIGSIIKTCLVVLHPLYDLTCSLRSWSIIPKCSFRLFYVWKFLFVVRNYLLYKCLTWSVFKYRKIVQNTNKTTVQSNKYTVNYAVQLVTVRTLLALDWLGDPEPVNTIS